MQVTSNTKKGRTKNNKIRRLSYFIVFFSLLTIYTLNTKAQNVKILSLEEALSLAKKNNSELINARLDLLKSNEAVSEAYSENLLPTITLNSRYYRAFKKQVFDIFGQKYEVGSDNTIENILEVSESIPILGTPVFQGIRIAEYYEKLNSETVMSVESKVKTDVKKAFYYVLLAKEVIEANKHSLANSQENFNVVEAKYRHGIATEFDYLRAKITYETLIPTLQKSENDLKQSKLLLKVVIGLKAKDEDIDVTGSLIYDSTEVFGPMDEIINKIVEENVAVRQLRINMIINKELVKVDKANYLPKLYLFGQYSLVSMENDDRSLTNYRFFNVINAGIGLTWDLNIFKNDYKVHQSEIEVKKTEESILDIKEKLRSQSKSVIIRMEDAKNRIVSQYENVKLAERSLALASLSFKNGVINQIDVLNAELMLHKTRLSYLQAIFDYLTAKSELEGLLEK
jgi:outer membrane protein TolC